MIRRRWPLLILGVLVSSLCLAGPVAAKTHHKPHHKPHHHKTHHKPGHEPHHAAAHASDEGEGRLDLLVWRGYAEDAWVKPFEQHTSCTVVTHDAVSPADMVQTMRFGGNGAVDLVSAPAEITQTLIDRHEVTPIDVTLIPGWNDFFTALKSPAFNTVKGVHWGLSYEWGPNTLIWNTARVTQKPDSWAILYDPRYRDHIAVPDNVFQIADAALYLAKARPALKIKDPFELNPTQMAAVTALLQQQRPLIRNYWALAAEEITQFKSGRAWIGVGGPYQVAALKSAGVAVAEMIPAEGVTAWADSWMLASRARHPNCAYLWMQWASTPQVQSAQALYFGETPANAKACRSMDALKPGSCRHYHADGVAISKFRFQRAPQKHCAKGKDACTDLAQWHRIWAKVKE